jgi:hypothetical protein
LLLRKLQRSRQIQFGATVLLINHSYARFVFNPLRNRKGLDEKKC